MRFFAQILAFCILFSAGCASTRMEEVIIAFKDGQKGAPKVERAMTEEQVLRAWGAPLAIVPQTRGFNRRIWVYETILKEGRESPESGSQIVWFLYFDGQWLRQIAKGKFKVDGHNYHFLSRIEDAQTLQEILRSNYL